MLAEDISRREKVEAWRHDRVFLPIRSKLFKEDTWTVSVFIKSGNLQNV